MADDLGNEWWLQENTENEETTAQNKAKTGRGECSRIKVTLDFMYLKIKIRFLI